MTGSSLVRDGRTRGQVLRYLLLGGTNTLLTYGIFVALGLLIPAWIAYSIAFGLGLLWTAFGSSHFVFRSRFVIRRVALFIGCYLVIYGVGQVVIRLVDPRELPELLLTSVIVLVVTTPLIFVSGRYIFGRDDRGFQNIEKGSSP